jgi:hypothetical protein
VSTPRILGTVAAGTSNEVAVALVETATARRCALMDDFGDVVALLSPAQVRELRGLLDEFLREELAASAPDPEPEPGSQPGLLPDPTRLFTTLALHPTMLGEPDHNKQQARAELTYAEEVFRRARDGRRNPR